MNQARKYRFKNITVKDKADRLADSSVARAIRGLFATEEATYAYAYAA